ncbi:hypothetical protein [Flavobacterium sp. DG2-3]|uniref:DUF7151 family protein n=1 Tax=Flavobacterium sp. DG2-3 TaxID=3068317 RepID=UPI00273D7838|nr:hypothetical protein [Flavobacterium sp. DG2-3]MDP5197958.1 hypothetical protein [Flavobacterium sp. DG2-3]
MKKLQLFYLFVSILFIACEGDEGPVGEQGSKGINTLVNMSVINPGVDCENGGIKVETGLDSNFNGVLDSSEVQNTKYVCNGVDGKNTLTAVVKEPAGASCENGGIKINSGLDLNRNGILEESEITSTAYVCNGVDGNSSLTRTTNENSGGNCGNGGLKVEYGLDVNNDGVLNDNEVKYTTYVCNGLNGNLSLVNITDETTGGVCGNGGIKIESGIDLNNNKILDNSEIQTTKYVCNEKEGIISEEIRIQANYIQAYSNSSTIPRFIEGIEFDITKYKNVDSIIFESNPNVTFSSNYALLELYNFTDNVVIPNSLIRTNNDFTNVIYLQTNNIINGFPQKKIRIGLKLRSEIDGQAAQSGIGYIILKTKK